MSKRGKACICRKKKKDRIWDEKQYLALVRKIPKERRGVCQGQWGKEP